MYQMILRVPNKGRNFKINTRGGNYMLDQAETLRRLVNER